MKYWILCGALLAVEAHALPLANGSLDSIELMTKNAQGAFDVRCSNKAREVVTELDLKLDNVCPHQDPAAPTHINLISNQGGGIFEVGCDDGTYVKATKEDVLKGRICGTPASALLRPGLYKAISGDTDFFDQRIIPEYRNGRLANVTILNHSNEHDAGTYLTCKEGQSGCSNFDVRGVFVELKQVGADKYEYTEDTSGNDDSAVFEFVKPLIR